MGDITSSCTFEEVVPAQGMKYHDLIITAPATADSTDTITFTVAKYGTVVGVQAYNQTDDTIETYAIALSTGIYTITVGTGTNKARVYIVRMRRLQ